MSLYGQYLNEREGKNIIENEFGFATYYFHDKMCYIEDIYVVPQERKSKLASSFADEISKVALEKGCDLLVGTVVPSTKNATLSLKVLLGYGFELSHSEPNMIWFKKKLESK